MNLKPLSDKTLLARTLTLARKEREILLQVLWHLKEIEARKLYSDLRCAGLFEYCVKVLKYSEGQASRRISAMRLLKEIPNIAKSIEVGDLNLTQLGQAKSFFDEQKISSPKEKEDIVMELSGKSTRESEQMLWELRGENTPKRVTITVSEKTYSRLKRLQSLRSHTCSTFDDLFDQVCNELEPRWEPQVKRASKGARVDRRYVSVSTKAQVWKEASGKCQNCGSTARLEIDHIRPYALGGKTTKENLRLLCRNCNQRAGIRVFGQKNLRPRARTTSGSSGP